MARLEFAVVLLLAVGAFAMPQQSVGTPKPAPAKVEEPAKPAKPAVPELDETKVVAVIPEPLATTSAPRLPVEKPVAEKPAAPKPAPVKPAPAKAAPAPAAPKPAPAKPEAANPAKAGPAPEVAKPAPAKPEAAKPAPAKPEPKEAEKPAAKQAPAEKTCVETYRACMEQANWGMQKMTQCTLTWGTCLGGRLGIEF